MRQAKGAWHQGAWPLLGLVIVFSTQAMAQEKAYDFLIQNATVYDGLSTAPRYTDVAISHETIAAVGKLNPGDAVQVIDGTGLILTPGFIDAHTHSDFNAMVYPNLPNKITQGVTTEITGNCGMSAAPVLGDHQNQIRSVWAREGVQIPKEISWQSFEDYLKAGGKAGSYTHQAALVGHGNLRFAVMGNAARAATETEINEMKKILAQAMEEGAYGISFGLVYIPGTFAAKEELVALCKEAASHNGVCAFHMRSESKNLIEAIQETLEIAETSRATIQISHLKAAGPDNWPKIDEAFRLIEEARARGVRVQADAYPYAASFAELGVILPNDLYENENRVAFFRDPEKSAEILDKLKKYYVQKKRRWDNVMIANAGDERYLSYEGKTIAQISQETGKSPEEFLFEILRDTGFETSAFYFSQSEDVVRRVLQKPYVSPGSDSIADGSRKPHPRAFGTFPKILAEDLSDNKILLGEEIRKMTSRVAKHFGIKERGVIQAAYFADIILWDPETISDFANYENPQLLSHGIRWAFVSGRPEIKDGELTGTKSGTFLQHSS
ncbi:MAG: D-aminoacylase [Candidatus Omnitrophica bacterium]|nr:D-aminoacylase [Candidatus Omnitrophota bacterium]